ncbi:MAG: transporter substrate-binding protein [Acidimicrobiales bacterium]|nr:transporter substrate-binding protein [Acidimicrobiales bacterium]
MRRMRGRASLAVLIVCVALVAAACSSSKKTSTAGGSGSAGTPVVGGTLNDYQQYAQGEPDHIDPDLAADVNSSATGQLLFDGLTENDYKTGKVVPQVSDRWTHNDNFTQWVFHIRSGVTFSNGDAVLPSSFAYAWNRILNPALASEVAYIPATLGIKGTADVQAGKAATLSGLTADDGAMTLTLNLDKPISFVDGLAAHLSMSPLDQKDVEAKTGTTDVTKTAKYEQGIMIGNGPFIMAEAWKHNVSITLARNPTYWGGYEGHKAYLDKLVFTISKDLDSAYGAFQGGQADTAYIPAAKYQEALTTYAGHVANGPILGIYDWGFNMKDPEVGGPANLKLRQAIALSIDRDAMITRTYNNSRLKALGWTPPGVPGYQTGLYQFAERDLTKAKQLLSEWEQATGKKAASLKPIQVNFNIGSGHDINAGIIKGNLDELGVPSVVVPHESKTYFKDMRKGLGQFMRSGWIADYTSYDNQLYPSFDTAGIGGDNIYQYSSAEFDALIDKARAQTGADAEATYRQAEDVALNKDVVAIPLNWYKGAVVYATRVQNVVQSPLQFVKYDSIWVK